MKRYILSLSTLFLICSIFLSIPTFADETNFMPDIDESEKNLTVHFYVQKTGVDVPIEGAEIGIYKVAQLSCEKGSAKYTLLPEYSSVRKMENGEDVTFWGISGTESENLAKRLDKLITHPEKVNTTDRSGDCFFNGLEQGMYLVKELNAQGQAADYEYFSPYLISVPLAVKNKTGPNNWLYDVFSEPKTKIIVKDSDSDSDSDSDFDSDSDKDSDSDSDKDSDSDSDTDSDSVSSKSSSRPYSSTPIGSSDIVSQPKDSSKVKTGYISDIMILVMVMSISGFLMYVSSKSGQNLVVKFFHVI